MRNMPARYAAIPEPRVIRIRADEESVSQRCSKKRMMPITTIRPPSAYRMLMILSLLRAG